MVGLVCHYIWDSFTIVFLLFFVVTCVLVNGQKLGFMWELKVSNILSIWASIVCWFSLTVLFGIIPCIFWMVSVNWWGWGVSWRWIGEGQLGIILGILMSMRFMNCLRNGVLYDYIWICILNVWCFRFTLFNLWVYILRSAFIFNGYQ